MAVLSSPLALLPVNAIELKIYFSILVTTFQKYQPDKGRKVRRERERRREEKEIERHRRTAQQRGGKNAREEISEKRKI